MVDGILSREAITSRYLMAHLTAVGYVGMHFKGNAVGDTLSVDSFTAIDPTSPIATPAV